MSLLEMIEIMKKSNKLFNDKIRKYILSLKDDPETLLKCYKFLLETDYNIEKVSILMLLNNVDNVSVVLEILDSPVFYRNRRYIYNELRDTDNEDELIKAYKYLFDNEQFNLDTYFISGVLRMESTIKVVSFISSSNFNIFESEFKKLLNYPKENKIDSMKYRKAVVKSLDILEKLTKLCLKLYSIEYPENANQIDLPTMSDAEFKSLIKLCMEDDKYRTLYKELIIIMFFRSFKECDSKEFKAYIKKYDLDRLHGKMRYKAFLKSEMELKKVNN